MITSARIHAMYAAEKARLDATSEGTHKTILQGLRTLVHGELRYVHGQPDTKLWATAAAAIREAGLWHDPAIPRGSRPKVIPTPGPAPCPCASLAPGLVLPADFPAGPFEGTYQHALDDIIHTEEFTGAWLGMAYRFKACTESAETFAALLAQHGSNPPFEQRYAQDREKFEFFANGLSALECTFFGMHFLAELVKPAEFPVSNPRGIKPEPTIVLFHNHFPGELLTDELHATFYSQDYLDWSDLRNLLMHRIAAGRTIQISSAGARVALPPDRWTSARLSTPKPTHSPRTLPELEISANAFLLRRAWLSHRMTAILSAAHDFAVKYL
jgi:hypothetical protein